MAQVIADVISEHAEEIAIAWGMRDDAVRAPHYRLNDLAQLDRRIELHLDGLRAAGNAGWAALQSELATGSAAEIFSSAVFALDGNEPEGMELVLKLGTATAARCRALVAALGWSPWPTVARHIDGLLAAPSAIFRRLGIAAAAIHRRDPGRSLEEAIADDDFAVRARALRAVGELGLVDRVSLVKPSLHALEPDCRFWAAWTLLLLAREPEALDALKEVATTPGPQQGRAIDLVLRSLDHDRAARWFTELTTINIAERMLIKAAGALGDPRSVPTLIEWMRAPGTSRLAGESFGAMTGLHLAYEGLAGEAPAGFDAGPSERAEDEDVSPDPDENLDWPHAEKIGRWWVQAGGRFQPGTRYLAGQPLSTRSLTDTLRNGFQRQRGAAALELCLRSPGTPLFEVRAPAARQVEWLEINSAGSSNP